MAWIPRVLGGAFVWHWWAILVDVCSGGGGEVVPGVALTLPRACCLRENPDRSCELLGRFSGQLLVPGCHNLLQAWKD